MEQSKSQKFIASGLVPLVRKNALILISFDNNVEGKTLPELGLWAKQQGYEWFNPTQAVITQIQELIHPNSSGHSAPLCPVHRKEMRESNNGKGYYCPHKTNGQFCKITADLQGRIRS